MSIQYFAEGVHVAPLIFVLNAVVERMVPFPSLESRFERFRIDEECQHESTEHNGKKCAELQPAVRYELVQGVQQNAVIDRTSNSQVEDRVPNLFSRR